MATGPHDLTHFDEAGAARMVDVGGKPETARTARASATVEMAPATLARIRAGSIEKGDVLQVARLAAIGGVKRTADLIPLCHPLRITGVDVAFTLDDPASDHSTSSPANPPPARIHIATTVRAFDRTGVEMEALVAATTAALTLYDMCKAIDRGMRITDVQLDEKQGGKTGAWTR